MRYREQEIENDNEKERKEMNNRREKERTTHSPYRPASISKKGFSKEQREEVPKCILW